MLTSISPNLVIAAMESDSESEAEMIDTATATTTVPEMLEFTLFGKDFTPHCHLFLERETIPLERTNEIKEIIDAAPLTETHFIPLTLLTESLRPISLAASTFTLFPFFVQRLSVATVSWRRRRKRRPPIVVKCRHDGTRNSISRK